MDGDFGLFLKKYRFTAFEAGFLLIKTGLL